MIFFRRKSAIRSVYIFFYRVNRKYIIFISLYIQVAVEKLPEEISTMTNQLNEDKSGNISSENVNE